MDLDPALLAQLMAAFRVELEDQLQTITDGLIKLEKRQRKDTRQEVLNEIFRAAHNVKGSARGVGVAKVAEIAHHLESVFSSLRQSNTKPSAALIDLCLETVDAVRDAMAAFDQQDAPARDHEDLYQRLQAAGAAPGRSRPRAQRLRRRGGNGKEATPESSAPAAADASGVSAESSASTPDVQASPAETSSDSPAAAGRANPGNGSTDSRTPAPANEVVRVAVDKLDRVSALVEELQVAKIGMDDHCAGLKSFCAQVAQLGQEWARALPTAPGAESGLPAGVHQLLRVSNDALVTLGEAAVRMHKTMRSTSSRVSLVSSTLDSDVRMLRLVPAATLLRPMVRTVRDIARDLDKDIALEIRGDDIEMDRAVLEGVRDPLIHLLRNAIDHGIETAADRARAGKASQGRIEVDVRSEGGQIYITIQDDGGGIDADAIAEAAVRKKLVQPAEAAHMSPREKLELIFRPGFSSKEIITDVSGRGVGLDVVRANMRELKGAVEIATTPGQGTTFTLRLPLTLTTERGLEVKAAGQKFVIPSTSVDRILELAAEDIVAVQTGHAILIDGAAVPLRPLRTALELAGDGLARQDRYEVVVISKGWQRVAFLVDEVLGEREIVVKRLRAPLVSVRNVSGATLTGSGEVIMVLNSGDLLNSAMRSGSYAAAFASVAEEAVAAPRILVVDDSITTRTLERNILETHGYEVSIAADGKDAWDILQNETFDLIVTDIEMPQLNGFDLTKRIKDSERFEDTPVVIVSSLQKDEEKRRGIEVGADAYIVKGEFESRVLVDVVKQLV